MFKDQTIWITGASSGIGAALARAYAKRGAKLILSARRAEVLDEVKAELTAAGTSASDVHTLPFDVTDEAALPDIVDKAAACTGAVDLLFNNAGISQRALCVETDMTAYRKLFEIDVFAQIALTKAVLPLMIERGKGHLAITASIAGKVGVPYRTGYCAAKHAMMGFFDALRAEVAPHGLKVTTVTPGFIKTAIAENSITGDGSAFGAKDKAIEGGMDANACAEVIVRGMEAGKLEIPVGEGREMSVLWLKRFFPNRVFKMAAQFGKPAPVKS